jgi:hypothetical protein
MCVDSLFVIGLIAANGMLALSEIAITDMDGNRVDRVVATRLARDDPERHRR